MTNGEKIQTILDVDRDCTEVHGDNGTMTFTVTSDFWSAEYKEPNKSEIPTGSTTKNDLGVDCISRADVNRIICEYRDDAAETGSERDLERAYGANAVGALISKIPSVTPQEPILNKLKEKDEAKAVRYEGDGYADGEMVYDMAFCPNCEHEFEEDSENWECDFCPNCGQKLRWEE